MNRLSKIKKKIILGIVNRILRGTRFFSVKNKLLNRCEGIQVGKNTRIVTPIHLPVMSVLIIGSGTWIGHDFTLEGNGEVHIGDNCDLGPCVTCITGSHQIGNTIRRAGEGFNGIITVGNGTWIGAKAVLLPNLEVGNGVVVGAASVVTKCLSEDSVYAGSPAKEVKKLNKMEKV